MHDDNDTIINSIQTFALFGMSFNRHISTFSTHKDSSHCITLYFFLSTKCTTIFYSTVSNNLGLDNKGDCCLVTSASVRCLRCRIVHVDDLSIVYDVIDVGKHGTGLKTRYLFEKKPFHNTNTYRTTVTQSKWKEMVLSLIV